jgi:predicted amidophosphoribosyltransferase
MPAVKIDPMKLSGPWADGYVLERQHTLSSDFLGHDSSGNPQFDIKRSELGELVFRLKNRSDKATLDSIAETAVQFITGWNPAFDLIVPGPPSRKRTYQPVVEIATAIGTRLSKAVNAAAVKKIAETPELKSLPASNGTSFLKRSFPTRKSPVRTRRSSLTTSWSFCELTVTSRPSRPPFVRPSGHWMVICQSWT